MISVFVVKLPRREFISITVLTNSKNSPASNYEYYGFYQVKKNKRSVSVIISVRIVFAMVKAEQWPKTKLFI